MRKLALIALATAVVVLMVLLARVLVSEAPHAPPPGPRPAPGPSAATDVMDATQVEDAARSALTTPPTTAPEREGASAAGVGSLRIRVAFAREPDQERRSLAVRVSDLHGNQGDALRESPREFRVPGLAAGDHFIAVSEPASIGARVRAQVAGPGEETLVDVLLEPKTSLSIRWRAPDGRAIESAILDAPVQPGMYTFVVRASSAPLLQEGPRPSAVELASIQEQVLLHRDETTGRLVQIGLPRDAPRPPPPRTDDVFGILDVPARTPFWVGAWVGGNLLETQEVAGGQREVVFTTRLEDSSTALVPISLCLVDESSGEPVTSARVTVSGQTHWLREEQVGCCTVAAEPGWIVVRIEPDPGSGPESTAAGFAPIAFEVQGLPGRPLDLGRIALSRARTARFRVVDERGTPAVAAEFALVRMASYDGSGAPTDLRRAWTDARGILTFEHVGAETYAVISYSPRLDAPPFVFDGARIGLGMDALTGTIELGPARRISLVFDQSPSMGTLLVIETAGGVPVRTIEMDEFGLVPVWLAGKDYKIHLVEGGRATPSATVTVDADPYVLEIGR